VCYICDKLTTMEHTKQSRIGEATKVALGAFRRIPVTQELKAYLGGIINFGGESVSEYEKNLIRRIIDFHTSFFNQEALNGKDKALINRIKRIFFYKDRFPRYCVVGGDVYYISYAENELCVYISDVRENNEKYLKTKLEPLGVSLTEFWDFIEGFGLYADGFVRVFEGIEHRLNPIVIAPDGSRYFNLSFRALKQNVESEIKALSILPTEELISKCSFILNFILHIAGYDREKFVFLLKYIFALHYLGNYKMPALVLYSKKPTTGKTTFVETFLRMVVLGSFSRAIADHNTKVGWESSCARLISFDDVSYVGKRVFSKIRDVATSGLAYVKERYKPEITAEFNGAVAITTRSERFVLTAAKYNDIFAIFEVPEFPKDTMILGETVAQTIRAEILPFLVLLRRIKHNFDRQARFVLDPKEVTDIFAPAITQTLTAKEAKFAEILFDTRNRFLSETERYYRVSQRSINKLLELYQNHFEMDEIMRYLRRLGFKKRSTTYRGETYIYYIAEKDDTTSGMRKISTRDRFTLQQACDLVKDSSSESPVLSSVEYVPEFNPESISSFIAIQQHVERNKPLI